MWLFVCNRGDTFKFAFVERRLSREIEPTDVRTDKEEGNQFEEIKKCRINF
jgi:hypothetical protein